MSLGVPLMCCRHKTYSLPVPVAFRSCSGSALLDFLRIFSADRRRKLACALS